MSRIGKKLITIPSSVVITAENSKIIVKGKHGLLEKTFLNHVKINIANDRISIDRTSDTKLARSYHGLTRALIQNMILGVSNKFSKTLIAEGVGYKFQLDEKNLILNMGYTHPVVIKIPENLSIKLESATKITISGIDKESVGFLASKIRIVRPPEPYKGKGIMYEGEKIIRKAGKTGK